MSNSRKTQGDIDKLVKKIGEGIEEYEELYDKFAEAPNAALKERFEGDLKKEIKKLQRLREQVKALIQSPDVKDKKALEQARRRVEEKMEAFKVVERETKTKTFSKEGLANLTNNASETPQQHTESWIKAAISDLKEQIETAEFELQAAEGGAGGGGGGRRGKAKAANKADDPRETRLLRLRFHTLKLEQLLRLVVNEDLQPDEVDEVEEDVQRYIEENMEEDFEEEEDLYDRFDLPDVPIVVTRKATDSDDEEERSKKSTATAAAAAAAAANTAKPSAAVTKPAAPQKDTPPTGAAKAPTPAISSQKPTPAAATQGSAASVTAAPTPAAAPPASAAGGKPAAGATSTTPLTPSTPATPFAKKSVAAVVAAAAASTIPASVTSVGVKTPLSNPTAAPGSATAAPKPPPPSFAAAAAAAAGVSVSRTSQPLSGPTGGQFPSTTSIASADGALDDGDGQQLLDDGMDEANDDTFGDDAMPVSNNTSLAELAQRTSSMMPNDWEKGRHGASATAGISALVPPRSAQAAAAAAQAPPSAAGAHDAPAYTATTSAAPAPLQPAPAAPASNPTSQVWSALLRAQQPSEEKVAMHRMLDQSLQNLPHPHDVERVRPFVPPNPYTTKPHHPQTVHPGFSTPEMFRRFDGDTLFFIFYYQQQTYQQYLAAKELKRQSYRYHKKFKTWFQRHDKPKESTEEYESGAYVYFDYENGWCQRIKNDFVFKYVYLEDELV